MSLISLNTRCKVKLTFGKPNCSNSFLNSFASNSYRTAPRTIVSIKLVQISIVSELVVSSVKSLSVSGGGFGGGASAFSFSSRSSSPNDDDETIRAQNALVKSNSRTHVSFSDKTWVMSFRNCAVGGWSPRKRGRIMCIMCMFINARATDVVEFGNKQTHPKTTVSPRNHLNQRVKGGRNRRYPDTRRALCIIYKYEQMALSFV